MVKKCTKCGIEKPLSAFHKDKYKKSGYVSQCSFCRVAKTGEWYTKNREIIISKKREYYKNNKEKENKRCAEWRAQNPEKQLRAVLNWNKKNPERVKKNLERNRKKRLERMAKQTPKWADLQKITQFYKNCPLGYEVDHIVPLAGKIVTGLHVIENLQYLPKHQNRRKRNTF